MPGRLVSRLPYSTRATSVRMPQTLNVRHSGAKHIEVEVQGGAQEVQLVVSDRGVGFDVGAGLNGRGFGLTCMRERIRLVNGTIVIRSKPTAGTNIHACVPVGLQREPEISLTTATCSDDADLTDLTVGKCMVEASDAP
jgi:signal transduction histidine kinase